jgi:hypothetical protein
LPDFFVRFIRRRLERYQGYLDFKLDWLFGRAVRALRRGELVDAASGIPSSDAACIPFEKTGPSRISDHSPVFADIQL